ncbi:Cingulin [Leucoagaricus sp. SymC.cos]|nr:Cingulin [Leucoagaricus sp. SymC.cos]
MPLNIVRKNTTLSKKSTSLPAPVSSSPPSEGRNTLPKASSNLASAARPRPPLPRGSTESTTPTLARKPSNSSIHSTVSKAEKKRSAWRGVAKTLPGLLRSSRGASSTSLVSVSQDLEPSLVEEPLPELPQHSPSFGSKIPIRRGTLSPSSSPTPPSRTLKSPEPRSTSPSNTRNAGNTAAQGRDSEERTSAEFSDGSATMVDDNAHGLSEELSATKKQFSEITNECSALREHIRTLETAHNAQLRESVEEAVNHTKAELSRAHASELEKETEAVRNLRKRNEELASRVMVVEDDKAECNRAHAAEMQSVQSRMKNLQHSLESLQHELKMKDGHSTSLLRENEELKGRIAHLEEDSRVLAEGGAEAQKRLLEDVSHYKHQLGETQKTLADRDSQFTQLQTDKTEIENLLICAQASVDEKDSVMKDLQGHLSGIEGHNTILEGEVVKMEKELVDVKNSSQQTLQTTIEDHERQLSDAQSVTKSLRSELSSSATTIQQLQASLETARIDAQANSTSLEDHTSQLRQAREQHSSLQERVRALEETNKTLEAEKAELIRTHSVEVEAERRAIHNLRRSMESSQRDTSVKQERSSLLGLANEELRREVTSLKERRDREEEEIKKVQKDLEVTNATLRTLEEDKRVAIETVQGEKGKLVDEISRLQLQLEDLRNQFARTTAGPQAQGEEKLKNDLQKALATIEEQKTVIGRLQQSITDRSKEDAQPRQIVNAATRPTPSRSNSQRSRSSSTASHSQPSKASCSAKTPLRNASSKNSLSAPSASSPLKASSATASSSSPSHEMSQMLSDHDHAFKAGTDSESEGDRHPAARSQANDVNRLRQPAEAGLMYRMGHAVFGSLWRRIWG